MISKPIWKAVELPHFPALNKPRPVDVVVVGGGMTGLTAAYLLKQSGKTVCLVERDRLASGDTSYTTAHLTAITDCRLTQLVKEFGKERAALVWQAGFFALDVIEAVVRRENIDCDFRRVPTFLHAALRDGDEFEDLKREAALARELGFSAAFVPQTPIVNLPGIRFGNQAKFHPLKYLAAIAKIVGGDGSSIHEQSEVTEVEGDETISVTANGVKITCKDLIVATHVPIIGKVNLLKATMLQTKLTSESSYVIGGTLPGNFDEMCLWDTGNPYYYLRIDRDKSGTRFIFGGNDHKTGQVDDTEACYRDLTATLHEILPNATVDHRWSGQVIATNDGLPLIGELTPHQYAATGFNGNGITFGTIAALMFRDAIMKKENPWDDLFSVTRTTAVHGAWDYIKQNVDYPYYMIADRLSGTKDDDVDDIAIGDGRIIKRDGQRLACSRDEQGQVQMVSAICPHMGCVVHWNGAERTWDCPCHGSRFKPNGKVIAGPAETPLETANVAEEAATHDRGE
jgi:glycine/D-amino acid oxidase-like deaminating enzyme/nitrite reductase/ring-hydroxylating ferredoxin subunit